MTNRKVLITGGAGFIGSHIALRLVDEGHDVAVLDNLSPQIHGEPDSSPLFRLIRDKVQFIRGDVRNREDWLHALDGKDVVIHFAAETGTGQSMYEVERYVDVNVRGTSLLLELLASGQCSAEKMILASSRAIYGEGKYACKRDGHVYPEARRDQDMKDGCFEASCPICGCDVELLPTDEDSKVHPTSIYGITKACQESIMITMGKALAIPVIALRYQNVYGPGQSLFNPYTGVLSVFSTLIRNDKSIDIYEDGMESRDFVYVEDVVEATVLAMEKSDADYEVLNVGSGTPVPIVVVAQELARHLNASGAFAASGHYRVGDIRHNYADISKIRRLLGFEPKIDFGEGIRRFAEWVATQPIATDGYDRSVQELKERKLFK